MIRVLAVFLLTTIFFSGCSKEQGAGEKKNLLIYCGITMIQPMKVLASRFEERYPVKITLTQGGSQDLYDSIKLSKTGDLYLPGAPSYRRNNLRDGILQEYVFLGYNRIAIMVQQGNPKELTDDINQFVDPEITSVLANPQTGSIGRASQSVLQKSGIYEKAYGHAIYLTTDSRRLLHAMKNREADITLNWYAAGVWGENNDYVDIIELPEHISEPKPLELSLLSYSENPDLAKKFMEFAASREGLGVMKNYGFLTDKEFQQAIGSK